MYIHLIEHLAARTYRTQAKSEHEDDGYITKETLALATGAVTSRSSARTQSWETTVVRR